MLSEMVKKVAPIRIVRARRPIELLLGKAIVVTLVFET
jgi:hypothetical protein